MATLAFTVQADYDKLIALRNEITKLETQLKNLGANTSVQAVEELQSRLSSAKSSFTQLAGSAALAGAQIQDGFKKRIYDAMQTVFDCKEEIIKQKKIIQDTTLDVRKLSDEYSRMSHNDRGFDEKRRALKEAKDALAEQKNALFDLTQEQAKSALAVNKLKEEYKAFHEEADGGMDLLEDLKSKFEKITTVITAGIGLKSFVSQMIQVRSQFQAADTAIETMLGNKEKADELMSKVREYAKISPLEFSDVTSATQMMLGFNIEAEKVPKFLSAIGDVSMGNSQKFNSLTLAFSQMSAAGKLMGQDLNQMINAGFNPLQVMAQKSGKSIAELKEQMSKGAVTAEMVQQAFIDATSAGGKFYQMSEKGAQTIQGQMSMLQDAFDAMFNEIGTKSEGFVMEAYKAGTSLVQSYETVGKVIAGLILTYGVYKTAILVNIALEKLQVISRAANIKHMSTMHMMTDILKAKTAALNKVLLANPYAVIAAGITAVVAGVAIYASTIRDAAAKQREFNNGMKDAQTNAYKEQSQLAALKGKLDATKKGTAEYKAVKDEIISQFGQYDANLSTEIEKVGLTTTKYNELAQSIQKAALARGFQKEMEQLTDATTENLSKNLDVVKRKLVSKYGSEKGTNLFTKIQRSVTVEQKGWTKDEETQGFTDGIGNYHSGKTIRRVGGFSKEIMDALNEVGDARDAVYDIVKGREEDKTLLKDMRQKWGITDDDLAKVKGNGKKEDDKKTNTGGGKPVKDNNKDKEEKERIDAEKKVLEELSKLKQENIDADIANDEEGREKQLRLIENDWEKRKAEIIKQQKEFEELNEKAGKGKGLSSEQQEEIEKAFRLNDENRDKAIKDIEKADLESMRDYLKEYGAYEQQKLALTEEYEQKIAEARKKGDEGLALKLTKQKENAISQLDFEQLKKGMNWEAIFGNLQGLTHKELVNLRGLMKEYKKSKEYAKADVKQKKEVEEAYNRLESAVATTGNVFTSLSETTEAYNKSLEELQVAQDEYNKALEDGNEAVIQAAREKLTTAQQNTVNARKNKDSAENNAISKLQTLSGVITQLGNASELSVADLGNLVATASSAFGEAAGKIGGIIGAILGIIDSIGDQDIDVWAENMAAKVFTAIGSAFDSKYSLLHYIAGGALGSSDKNLEADIETLNAKNEELIRQIERLTDAMEKASVAEASSYYEQQKKDIKELEKNTQEEMLRNVRAYSNGVLGLGGKESSRVHVDVGMLYSDWVKISKVVGKSIYSADEFFSLTSEEMAKVAEQASAQYGKIKTLADDGYKNASEYMDKYIGYTQQLEELERNFQEKLTSTSFDSVRDKFKDTLMNMSNDTKDFAENFEDMMKEAFFEAKISDKYSRELEKWYDDFAEKMEGGELTPVEQEALRNRYQDIVDHALAERGEWYDAMGWSKNSSQEASRGYSQEMSEDTGREVSGRLTAVAESGERRNEVLLAMSSRLDNIAASNVELRDIANDTRDIISQSYLELQGIRENTEAVIKPIKQIADDISGFKTGGMRIK